MIRMDFFRAPPVRRIAATPPAHMVKVPRIEADRAVARHWGRIDTFDIAQIYGWHESVVARAVARVLARRRWAMARREVA